MCTNKTPQLVPPTCLADYGLTDDELSVLQIASTKLLCAAASGHLDLNVLAKGLLADMGLNADGKWVGREAAKLSLGL